VRWRSRRARRRRSRRRAWAAACSAWRTATVLPRFRCDATSDAPRTSLSDKNLQELIHINKRTLSTSEVHPLSPHPQHNKYAASINNYCSITRRLLFFILRQNCRRMLFCVQCWCSFLWCRSWYIVKLVIKFQLYYAGCPLTEATSCIFQAVVLLRRYFCI